MKHTHETITQLKAAYQLAEMNHNADPEHEVKKATFEKAKADFEQAEAGADLEPGDNFEPFLVPNNFNDSALDSIKGDINKLLKIIQDLETENLELQVENKALLEENNLLKTANSLLKNNQIEKEEKQEEAPKTPAPAATAPAAPAPVVADSAKPAEEKKN